MEDRSVLQWDKDDCASMGIVKFDLLALGMLNALHLAVDTDRRGARGAPSTWPPSPRSRSIYEMLTQADTVGMFQVESRAQMATLPRMKPKTFYDLAIEVALIRPGPIQGHSVHPYLRRRNGEEPVRYPHPLAEPILRQDPGGAGVPGAVDGTGPGVRRVHPGPVRPPPSGDDPQALRRGDGEAARGDLRRDGAPGHHRGGRRRDLGEAAGVRLVRLPREPLGVVRLHRLHVGLAQVPLARRVPRRPAQRPADGLLQPQLAGAGRRGATGWWCSPPDVNESGYDCTVVPHEPPIPTTWSPTTGCVVAAGERARRRSDAPGHRGAPGPALRARPGRGRDHPHRGGPLRRRAVHRRGRPGAAHRACRWRRLEGLAAAGALESPRGEPARGPVGGGGPGRDGPGAAAPWPVGAESPPLAADDRGRGDPGRPVGHRGLGAPPGGVRPGVAGRRGMPHRGRGPGGRAARARGCGWAGWSPTASARPPPRG